MAGRALKRPLRPASSATLDTVNNTPDEAPELALATVPDRRYADEYISREINGRKDLDLLTFAYLKAYNVLLYGPTGPGKTSVALAWAATMGKKFYSVASNLSLDPAQMFGKMSVREDGTFGWFDGGVTDIVRNGGLLLINEVNFMSPRIAPVLFELFDKRREITLLDHTGEKVRAHRPGGCWCRLDPDDCERRWVLVMADMNPGYGGTQELNAALRNRFPIQVEWDYDPDVEAKLVPFPTLRKITENIRKQSGRTIDTPATTNMMQEFVTIAQELGLDFAITNYANHFQPDERGPVEEVFRQLREELDEDFKPDDSEGWNQFSAPNAEWLYQKRSDLEEEGS